MSSVPHTAMLPSPSPSPSSCSCVHSGSTPSKSAEFSSRSSSSASAVPHSPCEVSYCRERVARATTQVHPSCMHPALLYTSPPVRHARLLRILAAIMHSMRASACTPNHACGARTACMHACVHASTHRHRLRQDAAPGAGASTSLLGMVSAHPFHLQRRSAAPWQMSPPAAMARGRRRRRRHSMAGMPADVAPGVARSAPARTKAHPWPTPARPRRHNSRPIRSLYGCEMTEALWRSPAALPARRDWGRGWRERETGGGVSGVDADVDSVAPPFRHSPLRLFLAHSISNGRCLSLSHFSPRKRPRRLQCNAAQPSD
eukprot:351831-Chlamydomonas_euryale.AAC.3